MSDLISRSVLLENFKLKCRRNCNKCEYSTFLANDEHCGLIDEQPTAYDVDKVVEELEAKKKNICGSYNWETPILERPSCKVAFNNGICEAIEIVKGGGVNERVH